MLNGNSCPSASAVPALRSSFTMLHIWDLIALLAVHKVESVQQSPEYPANVLGQASLDTDCLEKVWFVGHCRFSSGLALIPRCCHVISSVNQDLALFSLLQHAHKHFVLSPDLLCKNISVRYTSSDVTFWIQSADCELNQGQQQVWRAKAVCFTEQKQVSPVYWS